MDVVSVAKIRQVVLNLVHGLHVDNTMCMDLRYNQGHETHHMMKGYDAKQGLAW